MANRSAILTLPGLSTTTFLANFANVMDLSDGRTPVVLVDKYDYERLRGRHLKEIGENQKAPYLGMIYDDLERRGIIRFIDYSEYYPADIQQQYLQQNQKLIEEMPEWLHRQMAIKGAKWWKIRGRGPYQVPVRSALGESEASFAASRRKEEGLINKMERGGGDPVAWNRKLLNKSVAALEILHQANKNMGMNVKCIVGGPEHEIVIDLLKAAQSNKSADIDTTILDVAPSDITTEIPHAKKLDPLCAIEGINPEMNSDTRHMFDTVQEVATDIVGRGSEKWVILGPPLVIPQYSEVFDGKKIRAQINGGMDADNLVTETKQIINNIGGGEDNQFRYEAEKIADKFDNPLAQRETLEGIINQTVSMSNYSVEFDELIDKSDMSQAAVFTAAGILSDPIHRYDENDVYRYTIDLSARLSSIGIAEAELERVGMEASGTTWGGSFDWVDDVSTRNELR